MLFTTVSGMIANPGKALTEGRLDEKIMFYSATAPNPWLIEEGYRRSRVRIDVRTTRRLDRDLRRRDGRGLREIGTKRLLACSPADSQDDAELAVTVRLWARYLRAWACWARPEPPSLPAGRGRYGRKRR